MKIVKEGSETATTREMLQLPPHKYAEALDQARHDSTLMVDENSAYNVAPFFFLYRAMLVPPEHF